MTFKVFDRYFLLIKSLGINIYYLIKKDFNDYLKLEKNISNG